MKFLFCVTESAVALCLLLFFVDWVSPISPFGPRETSNRTRNGTHNILQGCSRTGYCLRHPNTVGREPAPDDPDEAARFFSIVNFEYHLMEHYTNITEELIDAFGICNGFFNVTLNESMDLFVNAPSGKDRRLSDDAKCLIDCTLTKMRVTNENGFDAREYMRQIRKLRFNHTSSSWKINPNYRGFKWLMDEKIYKKALEVSDGKCYYSGSGPNDRKNCYKLIRSYLKAVTACNNVNYTETYNSCEKTWAIVQCIVNENRGRSFDVPLYPTMWNFTNPIPERNRTWEDEAVVDVTEAVTIAPKKWTVKEIVEVLFALKKISQQIIPDPPKTKPLP